MSVAEACAVVLFTGISAYALFGGADFGVGFWDLFAGDARKGAEQRAFIERAMGPVWEANHVWLIFALVILWTCFPEVFPAVMSTLWIPLSFAIVGIMLRGSAYAFRKEISGLEWKRRFGAVFALSSVLTPFFFGAVAGAIASGRVPLGNAAGDPWASWINPTSMVGGTLAVAVCAFMGALFLAHDADSFGTHHLAEQFRSRALGTAVVTGLIAALGAVVLVADEDGWVFGSEPSGSFVDGLTGRAVPLLVLSAVAGVATIVLVWRRRYSPARLAGGAAVLAVIWGWAFGQYPDMLPGVVTIEDAAGVNSTLVGTLVSVGVGAVLLVPALTWLYVLMQRGVFVAPVEGEDLSAVEQAMGGAADRTDEATSHDR